MKHLVIISTLLLSACATQLPVWQQELNNVNRQWRTHDDPVIATVHPAHFDTIRNGTITGISCKF
jgi:outer membrane biogenesis lipoprotein LolB